MAHTNAYAAQAEGGPLAPFELERRAIRSDDVAIDIDYCGVCHTDIHYVKNDWGRTIYPLVPGHEIIGRVTAAGSDVTRYGVGDVVGVGCMVDSCRSCSACEAGLEQFCLDGQTVTYNGTDRHDGSITY
ncbi:MAG: alcohol dehydrogenase catalytic domain-containing protein, partial [Salinisphaera sp.]|nr:alcohol dehydrogenase catalytic domain-containing protein [Salinisphaera sp.]